MPATATRFGIGCDCKRIHFCGHCMNEGRRTRISEEDPFCYRHGSMIAKDIITAYPEGHNCGKR